MTMEYVLPTPVALDINYRGSSNETSRRVVTVKRVRVSTASDGEMVITHLVGDCSVRRMSRSFKLDGIADATDAESGRPVPDVAAWIRERLPADLVMTRAKTRGPKRGRGGFSVEIVLKTPMDTDQPGRKNAR